MDPISFSLSISPLLVRTIEAYSSLQGKLDVLRHYSREMRRIRQRLDLERRIFLNETRNLVFTAVEDHLLATRMLDDLSHSEWQSKAAEAAFKRVLGGSFNVCHDVISTISVAIHEIQSELERFNLFESARKDVRHDIVMLESLASLSSDQPTEREYKRNDTSSP